MGLLELLMGIETPISQKMINADATAGLARGGSRRLKKIFADFHGLGMNPIGSDLFLQSRIFLKNAANPSVFLPIR